MEYYFYNTDAESQRQAGGFATLIDHRLAATGGARSFGEQLGRLHRGDTLLMYENRVGVVAVGTVLEGWDGKTYRSPRHYYAKGNDFDTEYRIKVEWFLPLSHNPITVDELKRHTGYTPRGAVQRIVTRRAAVERMIEGRRRTKPRTSKVGE